MNRTSPQGGHQPTGTETVIARAVVDVLLLRQEMGRHDIGPASLREALMAAALPAFIAMEAERLTTDRGPW